MCPGRREVECWGCASFRKTEWAVQGLAAHSRQHRLTVPRSNDANDHTTQTNWHNWSMLLTVTAWCLSRIDTANKCSVLVL